MVKGKTDQDDIYDRSDQFGIGHMSGGEIKDKAKVAGVINETSNQELKDNFIDRSKIVQGNDNHVDNSTEKIDVTVNVIKHPSKMTQINQDRAQGWQTAVEGGTTDLDIGQIYYGASSKPEKP